MDIQKLKIEQVVSVYSGIDGRCCCGCSGKHRYASAHREAESRHRGYPVTNDEISDRAVARIVNLMKKNQEKVEFEYGSHFALVIGKRLYVAYLKTEE